MWPFKKKQVTKEQLFLKEVSNILFPPEKIYNDNGMKYYVDTSLDSILEAVLNDLEEGLNDETTRKNLRSVANQLYKIREILELYREIPNDANFYVTGHSVTDTTYDDIRVLEEK